MNKTTETHRRSGKTRNEESRSGNYKEVDEMTGINVRSKTTEIDET